MFRRVQKKTSVPKLHSIKWKDFTTLDESEASYKELSSVEKTLIRAFKVGLEEVVLFGHTVDGREYTTYSTDELYKLHYMYSRGALLMLAE